MSKFTFLAIACGFMAAGAGLAALKDASPSHERRAPPTATGALATAPRVAVEAEPAAGSAPLAELNADADTTDLLLETPTVEEFLALADAASAEPLDAADRERLAAAIRSDPALRKQFRD